MKTPLTFLLSLTFLFLFSGYVYGDDFQDGAESIDLIDGAELCSLLRELKLGVNTEEIVVVDDAWFEDFK